MTCEKCSGTYTEAFLTVPLSTYCYRFICYDLACPIPHHLVYIDKWILPDVTKLDHSTCPYPLQRHWCLFFSPSLIYQGAITLASYVRNNHSIKNKLIFPFIFKYIITTKLYHGIQTILNVVKMPLSLCLWVSYISKWGTTKLSWLKCVMLALKPFIFFGSAVFHRHFMWKKALCHTFLTNKQSLVDLLDS